MKRKLKYIQQRRKTTTKNVNDPQQNASVSVLQVFFKLARIVVCFCACTLRHVYPNWCESFLANEIHVYEAQRCTQQIHNRTYTISIQNETVDNDQMGCLPFIHGAHKQKGLKTIGIFVLCPKKCDNHEWFVIFCVLCYIASIVFACEKYSFFSAKRQTHGIFCRYFFLMFF